MRSKNTILIFFSGVIVFSCILIAISIRDIVTFFVARANQSPTAVTWKQFDGKGYTLLYPADWYAQVPSAPDRAGAVYDLILSNAPDNTSPQSATPDESARVTVWYVPKPNAPLETWVSQRWGYLNAMLNPATIDDAPALLGSVISVEPPIVQEFIWIDAGKYYYTVRAYARTDTPDMAEEMKKVMNSLRFRK